MVKVEEQLLCPHCNQLPLPECEGGHVFVRDPATGEILINEVTGAPVVTKCPRIKQIKIRKRLGPEIAGTKHVRNSPLFRREPPAADYRKTNTYIAGCSWKNLLSHLKLVLGSLLNANESFRFLIVTDQQIKDVFVGNEEYRHRPRDTRDDDPTFNSVKDLVGGHIDLVIIRLGFLGHTNKAAPGALKEALMVREIACKPTWLIDDPNRPWNRSYSHDNDVESYIDDHFEMIDIDDPGEPEEELDVGMDVEGDDDLLLPKPRRRPRSEPPPREEPTEDFGIELPGEKKRRWTP